MLKAVARKIVEESSVLETARTTLLTEIAGLQALASSLDGNFEEAIDMITTLSGRVIISGMGKSAHVARKVAATLASTGQPAYFVHPGEASHGDLGMITPQDLVIVFSYSGQTQELNSLITYTRRFNIPLIAITGKETGTLAKVATLVLPLPEVAEACPMGLAPTTSTTMMMALGDALAMALLSQRGFSSTDFRILHPGGNLGNSLARVGDRMHKGEELPLVEETTLMGDVLLEMSAKGFGCIGVTDHQGFLVGVITDGDLRRHMSPDLLLQKAADIMTLNPATILPDTLMAEALSLLNKEGRRPITSLFVVESLTAPAKPCGIIHIHDFLRMGVI
jgi:arabinose-5-phosphate isomerase